MQRNSEGAKRPLDFDVDYAGIANGGKTHRFSLQRAGWLITNGLKVNLNKETITKFNAHECQRGGL
jgi:hypothetical protein